MIFSWIKAMGLKAEAIPRTIRMLKILEPTALPSAMSTSFLRAATMEVISSGRLVPKATMVRPMRFSLMPKAEAMVLAPSTTQSLPSVIPAIPMTMKIRLLGTDMTFMSAASAANSESSLFMECWADRIIYRIKKANRTMRIRPLTRVSIMRSCPSTRSSRAQTMEKGISIFRELF